MTRHSARRAIARLTLLCLSAAAMAAGAADQAGNYAVWGLGQSSCNQFARADATPGMADQYASFMMGFLSAYNALAPDTYQATGDNTLQDNLDWVKSYCAAHKTDGFERAITSLIDARKDQRYHNLPGSVPGWGHLKKSQAE